MIKVSCQLWRVVSQKLQFPTQVSILDIRKELCYFPHGNIVPAVSELEIIHNSSIFPFLLAINTRHNLKSSNNAFNFLLSTFFQLRFRAAKTKNMRFNFYLPKGILLGTAPGTLAVVFNPPTIVTLQQMKGSFSTFHYTQSPGHSCLRN